MPIRRSDGCYCNEGHQTVDRRDDYILRLANTPFVADPISRFARIDEFETKIDGRSDAVLSRASFR